MLKLMQNLLADYKVLIDNSNGTQEQIKWKYIEALAEAQYEVRLQEANKLTSKPIAWTKHKLSVKVAVQTLSSSVATAIDFLRDDIEDFV